MTPRQIGLHLGGLIGLIALLAGWYWQSTGLRAVPALTESLKSDEAKVRIAAAQALAEIGPVAKAAAGSPEIRRRRSANGRLRSSRSRFRRLRRWSRS
ncbi:MAG: HEAT repeat domain-containing protein [Burkholderiales bacterium]